MKQFWGGLKDGRHCKNGAGLASGPRLQLAKEPKLQPANGPKPEPKQELNPLLNGKLNPLNGLNPCGNIAKGAKLECEKFGNDGGDRPFS